MNYVKRICYFLIFSISITVFSQVSQKNNTNNKKIIDYSECITTTIFLPDESDLMIVIINESITTAIKNSNHYYINVSEEKNIDFLKLLSRSSVLDEVFIINNEDVGGYKEINTGKIFHTDHVKLLFQMQLDSPCHDDNLFFLMLDSKKAKNVLLQLVKLFNQNDGLKKLNEQIKVN